MVCWAGQVDNSMLGNGVQDRLGWFCGVEVSDT